MSYLHRKHDDDIYTPFGKKFSLFIRIFGPLSVIGLIVIFLCK